MRPITRPATAIITSAPKPAMVSPPLVSKPAETPVIATAAKSESAAPVVPAPQPEAPPLKIPVAAVAPKPPSGPTKAAPPHFVPRAVTNEIAATPPPKLPTQKPSTAPISDIQIYRPTVIESAKPRELRVANFVWFGAGLVLVGLVSFGYPAVRGRLESAVSGLDLSRFFGHTKDSSEPIRLDTAAVREAMAVAEQQFNREHPPQTPAPAGKLDAPVSGSPADSPSDKSATEPAVNSPKPVDAAAPASAAAEPKLDQAPADSMKAPHPKPRAPHKEESAEEKERRLAALKEQLGIPASISSDTSFKPPEGGTPKADVNGPPADTDTREASSTAIASAS